MQTNLNKCENIEVISSIFSNHNGMKLEINHGEGGQNYMETRQHTTEKKNQWVNNKNEIKEEILKYQCHFKKNDNENTTIKISMGCSKSSS